MTITAIQNPNDPNYWEHVKNRTIRREALQTTDFPHRRRFKNRDDWLTYILTSIACAAQIFDDNKVEQRLFREECAEASGIPCIASMTAEEIKWHIDADDQAMIDRDHSCYLNV